MCCLMLTIYKNTFCLFPILADSNLDELLSLSEEYQTDWLTERIENHLLCTLNFQNTGDIIEAWQTNIV